jgi:hypothetical protein
MRHCRNPECQQSFEPAKDFYVYCSWECRVAHVGEHYDDRRGWQQERNQSYDRGFWDGTRATPPEVEIPPQIWKALAVLVHPDRWQETPALLPIAHEAMVWLLEHRPTNAPY